MGRTYLQYIKPTRDSQHGAFKECLQINKERTAQLKMAKDLDTSQEMWKRQINSQEKCLTPCQPIFKISM